MNEDALYLRDSYLKEFEAEVVDVKDGRFIILDRTAFYPTSGGQQNDTGKLFCGPEDYDVVYCGKLDGKISHEVDKQGLKPGDKVKGIIDWERRYQFMKRHTAAHVLSQVIHIETGALITGGNLELDKCKIDFSLEKYDPLKMQGYVDESNQILNKDLVISSVFRPREEVEKMPQLSKLAKGLPEGIETLRILSIGDFDVQVDGGTHVRSTKEVGKIQFIKCENKGKDRRRLYYTIVE